MSLTIWKFPLQIIDRQKVPMRQSADILSVQFQGSQLVLWAMVDEDAPTKSRFIEIFGTGHPMPQLVPQSERRFLGTAQDPKTGLVWHVFELRDLTGLLP